MAHAGLAHERVATAACDAEAHAIQREHAREAFGYAIKLDERHCRRNVFLVWQREVKGKRPPLLARGMPSMGARGKKADQSKDRARLRMIPSLTLQLSATFQDRLGTRRANWRISRALGLRFFSYPRGHWKGLTEMA